MKEFVLKSQNQAMNLSNPQLTQQLWPRPPVAPLLAAAYLSTCLSSSWAGSSTSTGPEVMLGC